MLTIHPVDSDSTKRSAEGGGVKVESVVLKSTITRERLDGYYVILDVSNPADTVVVPLDVLVEGDAADVTPNALGMTSAAWATCHTCGRAHGYCTALGDLTRSYDPNDQLDLYRSISLEATVLSTYNVTCEG